MEASTANIIFRYMDPHSHTNSLDSSFVHIGNASRYMINMPLPVEAQVQPVEDRGLPPAYSCVSPSELLEVDSQNITRWVLKKDVKTHLQAIQNALKVFFSDKAGATSKTDFDNLISSARDSITNLTYLLGVESSLDADTALKALLTNHANTALTILDKDVLIKARNKIVGVNVVAFAIMGIANLIFGELLLGGLLLIGAAVILRNRRINSFNEFKDVNREAQELEGKLNILQNKFLERT